ncbi:hypothetical protein [Streptomyces sp. H27-C3]|nr:hypothetical protein [Streptomyces sp. H27-C3]MDJ0463070.1 hypothetical protein [Streptomyces sp. H27-C3]
MSTTEEPRECLDRHKKDHTCQGSVTGQESRAGTLIYRLRGRSRRV